MNENSDCKMSQYYIYTVMWCSCLIWSLAVNSIISEKTDFLPDSSNLQESEEEVSEFKNDFDASENKHLEINAVKSLELSVSENDNDELLKFKKLSYLNNEESEIKKTDNNLASENFEGNVDFRKASIHLGNTDTDSDSSLDLNNDQSQLNDCPNSEENGKKCDEESNLNFKENLDYDDEGSALPSELPSLQMVEDVTEKVDESRDNEIKEELTDAEELPKPKQRVFPLLYTFRTLFTSFLAEFAEDHSQDSSRNISSPSQDNVTSSDFLDKEKNTTINGTDSAKKTRFQCSPKNISENTTGEVKIVNSTELLEILNFSKKQKVSLCVLVLFYAPWCHFCAKTAPHYNALARAFPQLDVLAVDTSHFSYLNARFGTVAVPNIMLFHSRSAVRFNHSARVLENFVDFVTNNTGMLPNATFTLEAFDEFGPLPSTVVRRLDWLLWFAWAFVISCSGYGFVKSNYGQGVITRWRLLWQEHQHIE